MAILPQLVGHTLLNWSLKRFAAGVVAAATLLEPIFAAALAWALFSERITIIQGVGAAILLAGVGLAISIPRRPKETIGE
jgi:drug/metabolite transporter (DMT)-like permease